MTDPALPARVRVEPSPAPPPEWIHVDDLRAQYDLSYGEALLAALSSNWARLDGFSGGLGVVVSDRGQLHSLKRWAAQLTWGRFVPADCEDAETVARRHKLTLSDMVEACGRGWAPNVAAFASRRAWFASNDVRRWRAPRFEVEQVSECAGYYGRR